MKYIFVLFFFGSTLVWANENELAEKRDSIVDYAKSFMNTPYVWGGASPKGFDCSGFLYYVYKKFNLKVSRSSAGYANLGKEIEKEEVKPADIMVFTGTDSSIKNQVMSGWSFRTIMALLNLSTPLLQKNTLA